MVFESGKVGERGGLNGQKGRDCGKKRKVKKKKRRMEIKLIDEQMYIM